MAAEPVGTAYVIIRAITSQLSKDIKDGLDKGSKDADTDAAGRELGRNVGESAGDEFDTTWNEESSRSIRESADSPETKKAQKDYTDSFFGRFREHFRRGGDDMNSSFRDELNSSMADDNFDFSSSGEQMSATFRRGFSDNISSGDRDWFSGVNMDDAAGTFGHDLAVRHAKDYQVTWEQEKQKVFTTTNKDDSLNRGASKVGMRAGEGMAEGTAAAFASSFPQAFSGMMSNLTIPGGGTTILAQMALPLIGGAMQTIGAIIGEAVAVIGYIGTAAEGAGVAFAGMAAAALPAFFAIKQAFAVDSPLLRDFKDELKDFNKQWEAFGLATQDTLLPHLSNALGTMEKLIPLFAEYGHNIGEIVGQQAEWAAQTLTTGENQDHLRQILEQGSTVVDKILGAGVNLITPVLTILDAAMPIANMLADDIGRLVQGFSDWVNMKGADGLTRLFDKWYQRFQTIMSILGNLGGVLADVFGIGADTAGGMFESLDKITEKWNEWTNSAKGQSAITTFFENARAVAGEVFGLIGDIIGLIMGPMVDTGGTTGLVNFFKSIREEWLPLLVEWAGKAKEALSGPVGDFFKAIGDFIRALADNPEAVSGFFSIILSNFFLFTGALKVVTALLNSSAFKTFGPLILRMLFFMKIAGFFTGRLWKVVTSVQSASKILKPLFFGKTFGAEGGKLGGIFGFLNSFLLNPYTLAIIAIVAALTLLYFHVKPFRDFVDTYIIDPIQRLWKAIGGVSGIVDWFKGLPALLERFWHALPAIIDNVIGFFAALPTTAPAFFSNLWDSIWGFLTDDPLGKIDTAFHKVGETLRGMFDGVPVFDAVFSALGAAFDWLGTTIHNLPTTLPQIFQDVRDFVADDPFGTIGGKFHDWADSLRGMFDNVPVVSSVFDGLAAALDGIGTAIENMPQWTQNVINFVAALPTTAPTFFSNLWESIWGFISNDPFGQIGEKLHGFADTLHGMFDNVPVLGQIFDLWGFEIDGLGFAFDGLSTAIGATVDWISKLPTTVPAFFTNLWDSIWGFLSQDPFGKMQEAFSGIDETLSGLFDNIPVLSTIFDGLGAAFGGLASAAGGVKSFFAGLNLDSFFSTMSSWGGTLSNLVGTGMQFVIDHLPDWGTQLGEALGHLFHFAFTTVLPIIVKGLAGAVGALVVGIIGLVRLIGPPLLEFFKNLPALIWSLLRGLGNAVTGFLRTSGIADAFNKYWHGVADSILNFFKELPGHIGSALGRIGSFITSHIDDAFRGLLNLGSRIGHFMGVFLDFVIRSLPKLGTLLGKGLGKAFKLGFQALGKLIPFLIKHIPTLLKGLLVTVLATLAALPAGIAAVFALLGPLVWENIKKIPALTLAALKGMWNFVKSFLEESGILDAVQKYFPKVMTAIAGFFMDLPGNILHLIVTWGPKIAGGLLRFGIFVVEQIFRGLSNLATLLGGLISEIPGLLLSGLSALASVGASIAEWIWNGITDHLLPLLGTFIGNIPGWLGTAFSTLWDWGKTLAGKIWDGITQYIVPLLGKFLSNIPGWIGTAWDTIWGWGKTLAGKIWDGITQYLVPLLGTFLSNIPGWIGTAFGTLWSWGKSLAGAIWDGITQYVVPLLQTFLGNIPGWLGKGFGLIWGWGKSLAGAIWDGITQYVVPLLGTFLSNIPGWLGKAFGTLWSWGKSLAGAIWDGITQYVVPLLGTFLGNIPGWIGKGFSTIYGWGRSLAGAIWDGITKYIVPLLGTFLGNIPGWLGRAFTTIWGWGKSVAGQIWDGLSQAFKDYIIGLPGKIVDWALGSLGDALALGTKLAGEIWHGITSFFSGAAHSIGDAVLGNVELDFPMIQAALQAQSGAVGKIDGVFTLNPTFVPDPDFVTNLQDTIAQQFSNIAPEGITTEAATALASQLVLDFGAGLIKNESDLKNQITKHLTEATTGAAPQAFKGAGDKFSASLTPEMTSAVDTAWTETLAAARTTMEGQPLMPEGLLLGSGTKAAESWWSGFAKSSEKTTSKPSAFQKTAGNVTSGFAGEVGKKDADMVAPTNKLIDKILLTLARLVKEVTPKVINPFIMVVVDGINKAATLALSATNSLVDRVLLTMARLPHEVPRSMNLFILNVVVGMNSAATQATAAANRLVNQVVLTMASLAGKMVNILAPAGVNAATGLTNGFKLGLAGFISLLSSVDSIAVAAVGNLNGALVNAGQQLINGLIMGIASRLGELRAQAQEAARLARAAANPVSSALPWHAANGGIFSRPTLTLIGEAGREAVIPLTRPMRAMSVMRTAGLDTMLAANTPASASGNPFGGATDLSILRIDHAEIFDKVDVDIIAAQIRRAYMSLPGH